jgi:hypothetical protein
MGFVWIVVRYWVGENFRVLRKIELETDERIIRGGVVYFNDGVLRMGMRQV